MNMVKGIAVTLGITAIALFAVACSNGEAATNSDTRQSQSVAPAKPGPTAAAPAVSSAARSPSLSGAAQLNTSGGNTGIWVFGQGSITLEPDLAMLNIGVETTGKTVATARVEAATAMDAMVTSLKGNGVVAIDIQTQFFNISPQYQWTEVIQSGNRTSKQVLVGYRVTNTAAVKIRDMDSVGPVMDDVAAAGGDAVRINGIKFTVEDISPLTVQLREEAVADAMAKANQFAALTGMGLGELVFISETGGGAPQVRAFPGAEFAVAAAVPPPPTSISGGELEITMSVQAVFAIE